MTPDWVSECGTVTLYCADCLDVLPTLEAGSVDAVVTSPPYNQLGSRIPKKPTGMWGRKSGGRGWVDAVNANGYADDLPEHEYQQQQNDVFSMITVACSETASLFYNHQIRWRRGVVLHPIQWFHPDGWNLRQEIVWFRNGGMMMNARMFCRFDERILWFTRGKWKWNQSSVGLGTVWKIPVEKKKPHPVAYPIDLPTRCIEATTHVGDMVMDPYAGSGTTGVACINTGRHFIGIEKEPKYFDIAVSRIEKAIADRESKLFTEAAA